MTKRQKLAEDAAFLSDKPFGQDIRLDYTPLPKQAEFHDSSAKYRLFYGGMGSGKTLAGAAEAIQLSLEYAGNRGLVGRLTYPELRDSTWKEILQFPIHYNSDVVPFVASPLVKNHDKSKMELELFNGSSMIGRPLEDAFDKLAKNLNLGWAWIDELTEVPEEMWVGITKGRLRLVLKCPSCGNKPSDGTTYCQACKRYTIRHTAFGTTNPEGHDWVWKHFVANPGDDHFYVQAHSAENTYLTTDYLKGLDDMPDEWKKRYRDGSFDSFSGLIYPEYEDKAPYVTGDFDIPESWYRFIGIDHGYRNPTAVLWGAVDPKGKVYIYDEFYEREMRIDQIADIIKTKSKGSHIQDYLIDPSTQSDRGNQSGVTIFNEFEEHGIFATPAKNQVMAGINIVKKYLSRKDGKPNLQIFSNCKNLRIEMQIYRWKDLKIGTKANAPEKPVKKDDHLVDALRYMLAYAYETPTIQPSRKGFDYKDYLNRFEKEEHWMAV